MPQRTSQFDATFSHAAGIARDASEGWFDPTLHTACPGGRFDTSPLRPQ